MSKVNIKIIDDLITYYLDRDMHDVVNYLDLARSQIIVELRKREEIRNGIKK